MPTALDVQNAMVALLTAASLTSSGLPIAGAWAVPIATDDPQAVAEYDSPKLCVVTYEEDWDELDIGIHWGVQVRLGLKIYVYDSRASDAASQTAKNKLMDLAQKMRQTLGHYLVHPTSVWWQMNFAKPTISYHRQNEQRSALIVVECFASEARPL